MPTNIEIKARVVDRDALIARAQGIAGSTRVDIEHDDTFFRCGTGRRKLRALGESDGQLIFYRRADEAGPRASFYTAASTSDAAGLRTALTLAESLSSTRPDCRTDNSSSNSRRIRLRGFEHMC